MLSPQPLSVALIAKNEEKGLLRALESLEGIAREIVLVHNDCTDETVKVAEKFGAKCFEKAWSGFKEQKQYALSKCTQSWILCMDADEALSSALRLSIVKFIKNKNANNQVDGASFNRCSFFLGKWIRHGDWYPDRKLGLVRKGKAKWVGINPHAFLELINNSRSKFISGDLEHYSFESARLLPIKSIQYSDDFINNQATLTIPKSLFICSVARPLWRFFRAYILKHGFLDGPQGFIIAFSSAYETLLKHTRHWENREISPKNVP